MGKACLRTRFLSSNKMANIPDLNVDYFINNSIELNTCYNRSKFSMTKKRVRLWSQFIRLLFRTTNFSIAQNVDHVKNSAISGLVWMPSSGHHWCRSLWENKSRTDPNECLLSTVIILDCVLVLHEPLNSFLYLSIHPRVFSLFFFICSCFISDISLAFFLSKIYPLIREYFILSSSSESVSVGDKISMMFNNIRFIN